MRPLIQFLLKTGSPIVTLAGAYQLYENSRKAYQPSASDYIQAAVSVTKGIIAPPSHPNEWNSASRKFLEESGPKPVVSGVNRALHEYGVELGERELAMFLVQNLDEHQYSQLAPGNDLASELLISNSFKNEYKATINKGKNALEVGLDDKTLENIRKQAASAKVGEGAHLLYGSVKSTFSYGAIIEDDLAAGTYNQAVTEDRIHHIESHVDELHKDLPQKIRATEKTIESTKSMKQKLQDIRADNDVSEEEKNAPKMKS
ncbi:MAG: hypothetical protein QM652_11935 [Legionella sp.]|uniref:hypothetical protein n=1 Tax=Legionella sp. TaxID=459 RepID=UPI0039E240C4